MIEVTNIEVFNFEGAIRGMRNPLNSWHKSDSCLCEKNNNDCFVNPSCGCPKDGDFDENYYCIGVNDLDLMQRLYKGGSEHRKYLRQIFVTMDINAPLYWWKEFDTYKVGTVANSCSTMHKIHSKEFTLEDFSREHLFDENEHRGFVEYASLIDNDEEFKEFYLNLDHYAGGLNFEQGIGIVINLLNNARFMYLKTKDKRYWWQMIQLLPSSYNQKRTVTMNYENVMTMINQRSNHKLDEWRTFVEVLKGLPYVLNIRGE